MTGYTYIGPYLSLAVYALIAILILRRLEIPPLSDWERRKEGRPLAVIARQPSFIVAVLCAMVCYGVMTLLMAATPLAMAANRHPFSDAAFVIQWHMVGMFAPSFFTGYLINRFGLVLILLTGVVLNLVCVGIAVAGIGLMNFWFALVLLGIGWNFIFTGSTTLSLQAYRPEEKDRAQGAINFCVFATMAVSSFSSGALVTTQGWTLLNMGSIVPVLVIALALIWTTLRLPIAPKP